MAQNSDSQSARPLARAWKRRLTMGFGAVAVLVACVLIRYYWGDGSADAQAPAASSPAPQADPPAAAQSDPSRDPRSQLKVVASVNSEDISREELAHECLRHYGKEVLESLVNKYLIILECQRQQVAVTQDEVNAEIQRIAKRFGLPTDQWLKMLKQERGIGPAQYCSDIIWPTLALRKLAGQRMQVTAEEIQAEHEMHYGAAVKARLIACLDLTTAQQVRAQAAAHPANFGNLAKQYSQDPASASLKGVIPPIRKHSGVKSLVDAAFALKDGEVSPVISVAGQFIILMREELIPARDVPADKVRPQLEELVRDRKLRQVAGEVFQQLQKTAQVQNVMNDPALSQQLPGVAATINGNQVTVRELADRCIERHGEEVLDGTINHRLLEQACRKHNITITDADLNQEITRAAATMLKAKPDGTPDVETWIKMVTQQQAITLEVYKHDSVWPSVALKKLVSSKVQVTNEDLQRGYEANYGPRVRCRAIILDNLRRAQEVWSKARDNPTVEHFETLAEQYLCEANNRVMRGEVPPIQKHGGQPLLEDEAFKLKAGEISSIIQVGGDKFVILFCIGRTTPEKVEFAAVKDLIREDVHEKKLRLEMAGAFQTLQDGSTIDNFLAGTSHSPRRTADKADKLGRVDPVVEEGIRSTRRTGSAAQAAVK